MTGSSQSQPQPQRGSHQHQQKSHQQKRGFDQHSKILYFNSNDSSHFEKWRQGLITESQKLYGDLSSIFITDKYPEEIPLPTAPNQPLSDDTDPGGIQREYIRQQIANKVKEDQKLKSDKTKLFGFLLQRLSQDSITAVQRRQLELYYQNVDGNPDEADLQDATSKEIWDAFLQSANPLFLWNAIKSSHLTSRTLSSRLDRHKAQSTYASMKMGSYEKLDAYKFRFDNVLALLQATNCELPTTDDIITKFIESLNADYDELKLKIKNDDYAGIPNAWPATLDLAYIRATKFITSTSLTIQQGTGESKQVAFLGTITELNHKKQQLSKGKNKNSNRQIQPISSGSVNPTSNVDNATHSKSCAASTAPTNSNSNQDNGPHAKTTTNNSGNEKQPKRPCHICGEKHWTSNCPHLALCQSIITPNNTDISPTLFTGITLSTLRTPILSTDIILDNASEPNIFKSKELLANIIPHAPVAISGVNSSSAQIVAKQAGSFGPWDNVLYHPLAAANILSYAYTVDKFTVQLVDNGNTYLVTTPKGIFPFRRKGSFFVYDTLSNSIISKQQQASLIDIKNMQAMISKRQQTAIEDVRNIQAKLGYPGTTELYNTVKSAAINNLPITSTDVLRFSKLPPSIHSLKGKMTAPKPTPRDIDKFLPPITRNGILSVDLMKLEGSVYLIGVIDELSLTLAAQIKSRSVKDISATIKLFISKAAQQGWILKCLSDNEGAIKSLIEKCEISGDTVSSSAHVPIVERKIRTIKERVRTILHSLPYTLPLSLTKYLIYFVVSRLNLTSQTSSVNEFGNRPAFEVFFNRRIDYIRDLPVEFGQYVQIYDTTNNHPNTMQPRSVGAIALTPTGSSSGSVKFFSLSTKRVITRDKFKALPIPTEAIIFINSLTSLDDLEEDTIQESIKNMSTQNHTLELEYNIPKDNTPAEENNQSIIPKHNTQADTQTLYENVSESSDPVATETPIHKYNLRPRKENLPDDIYSFHISIKEGLSRFKQAAIQALIIECTNIMKYNCWVPRKIGQIQKGAQFIPSFCFFKEKYTPSGEFEKLKARLTSGGHRQNRNLYSTSDTSSPTCDPATVFLLSALAIHENMKVITADVEAAYLNAKIRKTIILKIDPIISAILCKLDPTYFNYLNKDQSLFVELQRALYGCLESARLWYEHLAATLQTIPNMMQSKLDPCLFYMHEGKEKIYIAIYVDDIKMISSSTQLTNTVKEKLKSVYTVKFQEGTTHEYLGMKFEYQNDKVLITSPNYINNLLTDYKDKNSFGYTPTPASNDLFHIDETSTLLSDTDKEIFHSFVARTLYLSKRNRPDLLCAVSFLTTRVQNPTVQDKNKLHRVINYINNTKDLALVFHKSSTPKLSIYIDASYAQHLDRKSHSGAAVQFNNSTLQAKSIKQKITTKSSTEAELVALSDNIGMVIHISQILKELGYYIIPTVYQDNKSTIDLIERGRPTSNSRHIDIKYFFVSDIQQRKLIQISHCTTNEMIGDILTKPIQGQQFIYLRNLLLGHPIEGSVVNTTTGVVDNTTGVSAAAEQQQQTTTEHDHYCSRYT